MGEAELETELDFSRIGRVNAMLARRLELLAEVRDRAGVGRPPAPPSLGAARPASPRSLCCPPPQVERLAKLLNVSENVAYTCETAGHFWLLHVLSRWEKFAAQVRGLCACAMNHAMGCMPSPCC